MKIRSSKDRSDQPNAVDKFVGYTSKSYRSFQDYVRFRDDDPLWMLAYKLFFQFVGIIIMVALSPFVILGFIIAVLVVL